MKKLQNEVTDEQHPHVLGDQVFAAIAAVEGVQLSPESRKKLAGLERRGLTQSEKLEAVLAEYRTRKKTQ